MIGIDGRSSGDFSDDFNCPIMTDLPGFIFPNEILYLIDLDEPPNGYDQPAFDIYVYPTGFDAGSSQVDVATLTNDNFEKYTQINALRENHEVDGTPRPYEVLDNELIIVEVFYRHETLWGIDIVGPFGADWTMYAKSSMRMIGTGRSGSE